MDAYLEFYNENAARRYPLQQDCSADWPDDVLLDVRGYSRASALPWWLDRYSGSASTGDAEWDPIADHGALFFRQGDFRIRIDVPDNAIFPYRTEALLTDSRSSVPLARLQAVIGSGWSALDNTQRLTFAETAPLELGVMVDLYRQQIDEIRVIHVVEAEERLEGDLRVRGGYGVSSHQSESGLILTAATGQGELGVFPGDGVGDVCCDLIHTITGVQPNAAGQLQFLGGRGIKIVSLPHKIQIVADTSALAPTGSCS